MDKLYSYLSDLASSSISDSVNGLSRDEVVQMAYAVMVGDGTDPNQEPDSQVATNALEDCYSLANCTESDIELFEEMYAAETEQGAEFTDDQIQEIYSEYMNQEPEQTEYALTKDDRKMIEKDLTKAGRALGILPEPQKKSLWTKIKNKFRRKKELSNVGKAWKVGRNIVKSPYGQLVVGAGVHHANLKLAGKINKMSGRELVKFNATDSLEMALFSDESRAVSETLAQPGVALTEVIKLGESAGLPKNTTNDAEGRTSALNALDVLENMQYKDIDAAVVEHDNASRNQSQFNALDELEQIEYKGDGGWTRTYNGAPTLGTLGAGSDFRKRFDATLGELRKKNKNPMSFTGENRLFKSGDFFKVLNNSMQDAIAEGLITGVYYQSLDSGMKIGSGSIKRAYDGVHAMVAPTLDKLQSKLENSGSNMANWMMPDGPTGAEIVDGMSDKDSNEIIKTLDGASWLSKLPENGRTLFLMNLSKSGTCYIDERGTLKKRNIVTKLLNTYRNNPDKFLEELPEMLKDVEDLYKVNALISKDSINTDVVYNKLKSATSYEQVESVLNSEFNVVRKPLVSLSELSASLSNDFISLMKTDRRYYKSLLDKLLRSVEVMSRENGADSLSAISKSFLRNLAMSENEGEIRRTVDKLLVANVKYLNEMLGTEQDQYSDDLKIEGDNANMENSPVKSDHGDSDATIETLGLTAGWDPELDSNPDDGMTHTSVDSIKSKETQEKFSEEAGQYEYTASLPSDSAAAPGFGVNAL